MELPLGDCPESGSFNIAAIEDKHFWFGARARLIENQLGRKLGSLQGKRIIDVGCGTGYVLGHLERAGVQPTGCDMHETALQIAAKRTSGALFCCDIAALAASDYDAAMLCDVIEHADDDVALIEAAARSVRPGGLVLITVPAHQWLWTPIDDVSGHKRRYTVRQVRKAMTQAGLTEVDARYFNRLLLPLQALRKLTAKRETDPETLRKQAVTIPPLNGVMGAVMDYDRYVWGQIPGASIIATARRPSLSTPIV